MDEAGRAPESPLIVAPPGLDLDPEVKAPDAVTENEVMSEDAITSNGASSHHNGGAADDSSRRVPFPADEIGKKKGPAHLVTESDAASDGSAAEPKDSDGHSDGLVSTASGVLDSGRQAVKQAMAATTNWFSPSAKSDASDSDEAATTGSAAPRHASPAVPGGSIMARRRRVPAPAPRVLRSSRPASAGPPSPRRLPPHRLAPHRLAPPRLAPPRPRHRRLGILGIRPRRLRLPRRPRRPRRPRPPGRRVPGVRRHYGGRCVRLRGRRPRRPHSVPRRQAPARAGQALRHPRRV